MKKLTPLIIVAIFASTFSVMGVSTSLLEHKEIQEGAFKDMTGAKYVGSYECKKCHERRYLEWTTTFHSKMMQDARANPSVIIGDFGSSVKIRTFHKEDVDYTIGNRWNQMYLKKEGDDFYVLPAAYHISSNTWVAYSPDAPEKRLWFKECAGCHATGVDHVGKDFKEPGIGCEACHGPGSNHVKAIPGFEIATIINPLRLSTVAAAQICGSCHSRGRDKSGQYAYPVDYMTSRGTSNLVLHFNAFNPKDNPQIFWPSGDGRHSYMQYVEWKQSEHAKAGITCTHCHEIHKAVNPFQTKLVGDNLCRSCHISLDNKMAHKIHSFGSCIACHMPRTGNGPESGETRSHTFRFASPELSWKSGGVKNQPNSCSGCHYHKDTPLEDLIEFLDAVKKQDMPLPFSAHQRL